MDSQPLFESGDEEESEVDRLPVADQALREPDLGEGSSLERLNAGVAAEWMRGISSSLLTLQMSVSLITARQNIEDVEVGETAPFFGKVLEFCPKVAILQE